MAILFFFFFSFPHFLCGQCTVHRENFVWGRSTACCYGNLAENQSLLSPSANSKPQILLFFFAFCVCVCIFSSHLLHPYHFMSLHLIEEREHNHTPIASFSYVLPLDTHSERASERAKEGTQYFIQQNFHSRHTCNICYKSFHLFIFSSFDCCISEQLSLLDASSRIFLQCALY